MKRIVLILITFHLSLVASLAQKIDLTQKALEGIELDYVCSAAANSKSGIYSDLTYWNRFGVRFKGWNGGQLAHSLSLPDGTTFWAFGDSFVGLISENRNRKHAMNNQPRNAAMIQTGEASHHDFIDLNEYVGTSLTDLSTYYKGKTWLRHPDATLSQAAIDNGEIDTDFYYWPEDATIVNTANGTEIQMLLTGYDGDGNYLETALACFGAESKKVSLKNLRRNVCKSPARYGTSLLEDGDHVYLYGCVPAGTASGGYYPVVARTTTRSLTSAWEYYVKGSDGTWAWQTDAPEGDLQKRSNITSSYKTEHPSVFKYGDYYYMCSLDNVSGSIYIMQATNPWGPFSGRKRLCGMPSEQKNTERVVVHPQLSRMGEIVLSYNMVPIATTFITKGEDNMAIENLIEGPERNFDRWVSADLCQPHFYRIFNWQAIYNVQNTGPLTDAALVDIPTGIENIEMLNDEALNGVSSPQVTYLANQKAVNIQPADNGGPCTWTIARVDGPAVRTGSTAAQQTISLDALPSGVYIVTARQQRTTVIKILL